jgi:hypothetical protein
MRTASAYLARAGTGLASKIHRVTMQRLLYNGAL